MPDNPDAGNADVQRQGIRDAVAEAKNARLEKAVGFPSPGAGRVAGGSRAETQRVNREAAAAEPAKARRDPPVAEVGAASPVKNGPGDGPLVQTDRVMPPTAQVVAANTLKAYGEAFGHRPEAPLVKAVGGFWEAATTAEPGTPKRAIAANAGFAVAGDVLKDRAGVEGPDPNTDATLGQAGDAVNGAVERTWPARPRDDDDQGPLTR